MFGGMFKKAQRKTEAVVDLEKSGKARRVQGVEGDHDGEEETLHHSHRKSIKIGGRLGEVEASDEEPDEEIGVPVLGSPGERNDEDDPMLKEAIIEHCKYLGIDPETQPEYVWIAKKSMLAPVPADWEQVVDDNGVPFYHNTISGESQWEHPDDEHYRQMFQKLLQEDVHKKMAKGNAGADHTAASAGVGKLGEEPGRPGKKRVDSASWDDWDDVEDNSPTQTKPSVAVYAHDTDSAATDAPARKSQSSDLSDWDSDSGEDEANAGGDPRKRKSSPAKKDFHAPRDPAPSTLVAEDGAASGEVTRGSEPAILESGAFPMGHEVDQMESTATDAKKMFLAESEIKRLTHELEHSHGRLAKSKEEADSLVEKHRQSLQKLREEQISAQDRAHRAEKKMTETKVELERVMDELSVYRRQHEGIKTVKDSLAEEVSTLKAEKSRMEQMISRLRSENVQLEQSLERVGSDQDQELAKVKEELGRTKEENVRVKKEMEEIKAMNDTLNASTNRRIQNSMQTARSAQAARKAAEDREKELEKELAALKSEKNSSNKSLEADLSAALKRARDAEKARINAEQAIKDKYHSSEEQVSELRRQLQLANKDLAAKTEREKILEAQAKAAADQVASSTAKVHEAALSKATARQQHASAQKLGLTGNVADDLDFVITMKQENTDMKRKLEATERKLRDAERMISAAEERADRAESSARDATVENELATSLGVRVYELEREKDKLEATAREAMTDKDLFRAQAEAALRERTQVLDRISVEQKRNDELVLQRQTLSEEKIKLASQLEHAKITEERLREQAITAQTKLSAKEQEAAAGARAKDRFDAVLQDQLESVKTDYEAQLGQLRDQVAAAQASRPSVVTAVDGSESAAEGEQALRAQYELRITALQSEVEALQNSRLNLGKTDLGEGGGSLLASQTQENQSLRSQMSSLQDQIRRLKSNAEEDISMWKRRCADSTAEAEALRLERNERKIELRELREEWKMLHKELRDVKVQELVARETAMRAEAKLEKHLGDSASDTSIKMSSFLTDMRGLVEQVAQFQSSPHRALVDSTNHNSSFANSSFGENAENSVHQSSSFLPSSLQSAPAAPTATYGAPPLPHAMLENRGLSTSSASDKNMQSLMARVESERARSANARREVEVLRAALGDQ